MSLEYDKDRIEEYIMYNFRNNIYKDIFKEVVHDSLIKSILPSVETEIYNNLFEYAEDKSLEVFKKNLKELLMYPPLKGYDILGVDPGFRTGCKYAFVNKNGIPSEIGTIFITSNSQNQINEGKR